MLTSVAGSFETGWPARAKWLGALRPLTFLCGVLASWGAAAALSIGSDGSLRLTDRALPVLCAVRAITGLRCPACGLTRSWAAALHGDWHGALQANAFGPLLLLLSAALAFSQVLRLKGAVSGSDSSHQSVLRLEATVGRLAVLILAGMLAVWAVHLVLP